MNDDTSSIFDSVKLTEATLKSPESEAEIKARLELERKHQQQQQWRERFILICTTVGLAVLFVFSLVIIALPTSSDAAQRFAGQMLPALASGLLGYFVGRRRE